MTEKKLKQALKKYRKEHGENAILNRHDFREFTIEHEEELGFSCEEIQNEMDRYMIARADGTAKNNQGLKTFISVIFDWEAIPDSLEEFETDEEFITCLKDLIEERKELEQLTITFK